MVPAAAQPVKPPDGAPSYLYFAREAKSPLITDKYPLHKAVAFYDLPGVKAAVAKSADVSLSVRDVRGGTEERWTPLRVALDSYDTCGSGCAYYPKPLTDIIAFLLCSGAKPDEQLIDSTASLTSYPLVKAASRNSDYILTYALLLAGADPKHTNSFGSSALHNVNCAYRGAPDHFGALTGALLVAFGADTKLKNKQGKVAAAYYLPGNSGNCPAPASTPTAFSCAATCRVLQDGVSPSEAAELRAGRVGALAARFGWHASVVKEVEAQLAAIGAALTACPAKVAGQGNKAG